MNPKLICKILVDCLMTILLLVLMAYQFTGDAAHGWFGAGMFVLFIIHNILNWKWYRNILKGKYTAFLVFQTAVNLLVFAAMIGSMISGIMMSRYVFAFLRISGGMSFARKLHMISSYWEFVLISMHLGLHWSMILGMIRKLGKGSEPSRLLTIVLRTAGSFIAIYGVYAFVSRKIVTYLFLRNLYGFFDYDELAVFFFIDYLAIMGLCVFIAYYTKRLTQKGSIRK